MALWLTLRKLRSKDPEARKRAAKELGSVSSGQPKALEALVAQLTVETIDKVRCALIEALGELRDPAAVDPVASCLENDRGWSGRDAQVAAAAALGRLASADAEQPLVRALRSDSPRLRAEACMALTSIGWQPTDSSARAWRCIAAKDWKGALAFGDNTFDALETLLQRDDFDTIAEGVAALGATPQSVELLVRALDASRFKSQRLPLLAAAAKLNDRRLVDPILALLEKLETEDGDARESGRVLGWSHARSGFLEIGAQRLAAVEALGELGDSRAAAPLERLREGLEAGHAAAQAESHAHMVGTLKAQGSAGLADAVLGSLAGHLDSQEDAEIAKAIAVALARLA